MKQAPALLLVVTVFFLGVAVGALAMHLVSDHFPPPGRRPFEGQPGFHHLGPQMMERLDLTPEQRRKVEEIMERGRRDFEEMRVGMMPEIRQRLDETHRQIAEVLTPEQRAVFERMVDDFHRSRADRWHGPWHQHPMHGRDRLRQPPPPGPPPPHGPPPPQGPPPGEEPPPQDPPPGG